MIRFVLILLILTSCSSVRMLQPIKPIIVIDKAYIYQTKIYQYTFTDAIERKFISYEKKGFYNIGDTIK